MLSVGWSTRPHWLVLVPFRIADRLTFPTAVPTVPLTCADFKVAHPLVMSGPTYLSGYSGMPEIVYCDMSVTGGMELLFMFRQDNA